MSNHCEVCEKLKWSVMDARNMKEFADGHFDAVIEKATLDALLVDEKDPWQISSTGQSLMEGILKEISRVMKANGTFLSISFAQPHFRSKLYLDRDYGWHVEASLEIGTSFHHYYYHLVKSGKWTEELQLKYRYEPPNEIPLSSESSSSSATVTSAEQEKSSLSWLFCPR